MYSHEIDSEMRDRNYRLPSDLYLEICGTSPQIERVVRNTETGRFYIETKDGYGWTFDVYPVR